MSKKKYITPDQREQRQVEIWNKAKSYRSEWQQHSLRNAIHDQGYNFGFMF